MRESASVRYQAYLSERKTGRCPIIISIEAIPNVRDSMESAGSSPLILQDSTVHSAPVLTDRAAGMIITDKDAERKMRPQL